MPFLSRVRAEIERFEAETAAESMPSSASPRWARLLISVNLNQMRACRDVCCVTKESVRDKEAASGEELQGVNRRV